MRTDKGWLEDLDRSALSREACEEALLGCLVAAARGRSALAALEDQHDASQVAWFRLWLLGLGDQREAEAVWDGVCRTVTFGRVAGLPFGEPDRDGCRLLTAPSMPRPLGPEAARLVCDCCRPWPWAAVLD